MTQLKLMQGIGGTMSGSAGVAGGVAHGSLEKALTATSGTTGRN